MKKVLWLLQMLLTGTTASCVSLLTFALRVVRSRGHAKLGDCIIRCKWLEWGLTSGVVVGVCVLRLSISIHFAGSQALGDLSQGQALVIVRFTPAISRH